MANIVEVLNILNLSHLIEHFENQGIDLDIFNGLDKAELAELVPQLGARIKLKRWLADKNGEDEVGRTIEVDFEFLHPGKSNSLLSNWNNAEKKLEKFVLQNSDLSEESPDDRALRILEQLPKIVPANLKRKNKSSFKPTLIECSESLIHRVSSVQEITTVVAERQLKYEKVGLMSQPAIFCVESNSSKYREYYLRVDFINYKFDKIIKTVDISLKLHFALNCSYPFECNQAYIFLQKYFYKIDTVHDQVSPSLAVLLKHMNK